MSRRTGSHQICDSQREPRVANDMTPAFGAGPGAFDLLAFMEGDTSGWGVFEDRFGRVKKSFTVQARGTWEGRSLTLNESFLYGDGSREQRVWQLTAEDAGRFTGRCDDCQGIAHGSNEGLVTTFDYTFLLQMSGRPLALTFADRFYPVGRVGVVNRTRVSKFGLRVGEVSAVFVKGAQLPDEIVPELGADITALADRMAS